MHFEHFEYLVDCCFMHPGARPPQYLFLGFFVARCPGHRHIKQPDPYPFPHLSAGALLISSMGDPDSLEMWFCFFVFNFYFFKNHV